MRVARQVKVESFAQQKQQRRPLDGADLERRDTIREADGKPHQSVERESTIEDLWKMGASVASSDENSFHDNPSAIGRNWKSV